LLSLERAKRTRCDGSCVGCLSVCCSASNASNASHAVCLSRMPCRWQACQKQNSLRVFQPMTLCGCCAGADAVLRRAHRRRRGGPQGGHRRRPPGRHHAHLPGARPRSAAAKRFTPCMRRACAEQGRMQLGALLANMMSAVGVLHDGPRPRCDSLPTQCASAVLGRGRAATAPCRSLRWQSAARCSTPGRACAPLRCPSPCRKLAQARCCGAHAFHAHDTAVADEAHMTKMSFALAGAPCVKGDQA